MEVSRIIAEIDAQITKLQQARALIQGAETDAPKRGRGRPRKNVAVSAASKGAAGKKKRSLSPDARKRIAEAQKRRWAERRKSA